MNKVTLTSLAIALTATTSVLAQTVKYDVNVAKAAAAKAAEKIGDIHGSIDYDQVPDLVTKEDIKDKSINTSFLPQPKSAKQVGLPPMTSARGVLGFIQESGIDNTITGSIGKRNDTIKRKIIWEKFDRYGNPIK